MTAHELAERLLKLPDVPVVLGTGGVVAVTSQAVAPDWSALAPVGWVIETPGGAQVLHLVERGSGLDAAYRELAAGRVSL